MCNTTITKSDVKSFPIFDGNESMTAFMRRVSQFNIEMMQNKYDKILEFINELAIGYNKMNQSKNKKYSSLTEFNISHDKIIKNAEWSNKVINLFKDDLVEVLNMSTLELTCILSDDEMDNETEIILIFLKKILNSINYSIIAKNIDEEMFYFIKAQPQKISKYNY